MNIWTATHRITRPSGTELVMLVDDGAAYTQGEWDASDAADYECTEAGEWTFQGQPFTGTVEHIATNGYQLAFMAADGSWDIAATFTAENDAAANQWAELHYAGQEWYVLDAAGNNINAW